MKKRKLNEKMGGRATGASYGINSQGPADPRYITKYPSGYNMGGYSSNADSTFSQRLALASTLEEDDESIEYAEDPNLLYEKEESLIEFFARIMKMPLEEAAKIVDEDKEEEADEEEEVSEYSGGGVAGVGMKLGYNADGTPTTKKQRANWKPGWK
mgnify:CR=1 FL=1|tara:strand:+ start:9777 stop:10244 length:468 start_codon:yes stop_codon:yes gene_type:complete